MDHNNYLIWSVGFMLFMTKYYNYMYQDNVPDLKCNYPYSHL
jgi:hypothetical protein